ncbi:MAG: AAA family ATPase [Cryomorphaceae bacterium]
MKQESEFIGEVSENMAFLPKEDQQVALSELYRFLFEGGPKSAFILKGYAGTGKTTLMGALIRWLHSVNRKTVLLAPTGRSAKVLASHSGFPASTIHRRIYAMKENDFGRPSVQLVQNKSEKTIFIIDEASMIGERNADEGFGSRSLLEDVVTYTYSGERCRLILIGDDAQLPPVGMEVSPALDKKRMASIMHGPVYETTLTEVVRQASSSLILRNATDIRNQIRAKEFDSISLGVSKYEACQDVDSYEMEDLLSQFFYNEEAHQSVIICRSNKDANQFNLQVRARILMREAELEAGDRLMIVRNNYHWKLPGSRQSFLANGDMIGVERIHAIREFGPFKFAEVQVHFIEDPTVSFELILLMNSLTYEGPSIPSQEMKHLRKAMIDSNEIDANDPEEKFFQNPYFHAVQVKYAYAITCHKSQGGQWERVMLYQGYFTDEMMDKSYFRWLYTAVTRASESLYLVGFHPSLLTQV